MAVDHDTHYDCSFTVAEMAVVQSALEAHLAYLEGGEQIDYAADELADALETTREALSEVSTIVGAALIG